ncbi:hypothetical protein [Rubritalea tangerina]
MVSSVTLGSKDIFLFIRYVRNGWKCRISANYSLNALKVGIWCI